MSSRMNHFSDCDDSIEERTSEETTMTRCVLISRVWFLAISLFLVGTSMALAQNPLPPPTLLRPLTDGIPNVPGSDAISTGDGARVAFSHVAGATHYHICFRAPGNICQDQFNPPLQSMFPVAARINPSIQVAPGGTIEFFLPISNGFQGGRIQWEVKSCTGPNPTQCGQASPFQQVIVLLPQAAIAPNSPSSIPNNRTVTLQWSNHPQANQGPQLIILPQGLPQNLSALFTMVNPTVAAPSSLSIPLQPGATSHTMTLPPELGPAIKWAVANCRDFPNKGRRCSQIITSWKSMQVPNFFSTVIMPTMLHPRCVNCHLAPPNGFPPGHRTASTVCGSCHDATKPIEGNINLEWHAPPTNMNFVRGQNETVTQHIQRLCSAARLNGSGFQHLTQDKLILWGVKGVSNRNVAVPSGGAALQAAPPGNVQAWQNQVYSWWFATQKACD